MVDNDSTFFPETESILDVRTSILQAGSALLRERGIAALTQPKVAKMAGVKQSHLTYYFPKRSDLLLGVAAHTIDAVLSDLAARLETTPPRAAFAETLGAAMIDGIPPKIVIGLIVAADEEPALRIPLRELIGTVRARFREMLERAGVPDSTNAALLFHAAIVGLAVMHHAQRTAASAQDAQDGIAGILHLLGAPVLSCSKENAR